MPTGASSFAEAMRVRCVACCVQRCCPLPVLRVHSRCACPDCAPHVPVSSHLPARVDCRPACEPFTCVLCCRWAARCTTTSSPS